MEVNKRNKFLTKWVTYEKYIFILGIVGIAMNIAKITAVVLHTSDLITKYKQQRTFTIIFCAYFFIHNVGLIILELSLFYSSRTRKLQGLQYWMFVTMILTVMSVLASVISLGRFSEDGWWLSLAFALDIFRNPVQAYYVHRFIKTEHINKDTSQVTTKTYRRMQVANAQQLQEPVQII